MGLSELADLNRVACPFFYFFFYDEFYFFSKTIDFSKIIAYNNSAHGCYASCKSVNARLRANTGFFPVLFFYSNNLSFS